MDVKPSLQWCCITPGAQHASPWQCKSLGHYAVAIWSDFQCELVCLSAHLCCVMREHTCQHTLQSIQGSLLFNCCRKLIYIKKMKIFLNWVDKKRVWVLRVGENSDRCSWITSSMRLSLRSVEAHPELVRAPKKRGFCFYVESSNMPGLEQWDWSPTVMQDPSSGYTWTEHGADPWRKHRDSVASCQCKRSSLACRDLKFPMVVCRTLVGLIDWSSTRKRPMASRQ